MSTTNLAKVEIEVYKPHPDKPGFLALERRKTPNEVTDELEAGLKDVGLEGEFDYFGLAIGTKFQGHGDKPIPKYHHAVAYVVRGGSEGYYVHVDVALPADGVNDLLTHLPIAVGKTFSKTHAWAAVRALSDMLDW